MPQQAWSQKRERQYEHIKESQENRGVPEPTAKEVAARTVNKERARAGESRQASRTSVDDISSGRRGGLRSHRGAGGRSRDQLYEEASSAASEAARRCRNDNSKKRSEDKGSPRNRWLHRFYGVQFRWPGLAPPSGGYRFNSASRPSHRHCHRGHSRCVGPCCPSAAMDHHHFCRLVVVLSAVSLVMGETALRRHAPNQKRGTK